VFLISPERKTEQHDLQPSKQQQHGPLDPGRHENSLRTKEKTVSSVSRHLSVACQFKTSSIALALVLLL
jgi:hypothetical protein